MNGVAAFYDLDKSMQMNPNHQLHTQDHQGTIRCLHSWQYPRKPIIIMIALAPPIGIIMDHLFHLSSLRYESNLWTLPPFTGSVTFFGARTDLTIWANDGQWGWLVHVSTKGLTTISRFWWPFWWLKIDRLWSHDPPWSTMIHHDPPWSLCQDTYILASSTSSGHLALISSKGKCFSSAAVDAVAWHRCEDLPMGKEIKQTSLAISEILVRHSEAICLIFLIS